MPRRTRLYVHFLRALLTLLPAVTLAGYFLSDRIAGLLPETGWFAIVFLLAGIAIVAWLEVVTGQWAIEGPIYARALRRVGAKLRLTKPNLE